MTTEDFEKAIDAQTKLLYIDEMVLGKGGQVKKVYGHGPYIWVKWDPAGRCFAVPDEKCLPLEPIEGHRKIACVRWKRYEFYDLKFDNVMKKEDEKTASPAKWAMTDEQRQKITDESIDGWCVMSSAIKLMILGKIVKERREHGNILKIEFPASLCVLAKAVADSIKIYTDEEEERQELHEEFLTALDDWMKDDDVDDSNGLLNKQNRLWRN